MEPNSNTPVCCILEDTVPSYSSPSSLNTDLQASPICQTLLFFPPALSCLFLTNSLLDFHALSYSCIRAVSSQTSASYPSLAENNAEPIEAISSLVEVNQAIL